MSGVVRSLLEVLMPYLKRRHKPTHADVIELLFCLERKLDRMEDRIMATQDQVNALSQRLNTVGSTLSEGVANIRQDIEDIKAENPSLDLSSLESSVASLETGVQGVTELDSEYPAQTPDQPQSPVEGEGPVA